MNPTLFNWLGEAPRSATSLALMALLMAGAVSPSQAQYKVIGSDGRITYTDQPPLAAGDKMSQVKTQRIGPSADVSLPAELRQIAQRYPVTLYVSANCAPCDQGRQLLRSRGIPHLEKTVVTGDDGEALQRLTNGRDLPALSIGAQVVRGLSSDTWTSYLDAAGYPKESKLPPSYQFPPASPLTQRTEAPRETVSARPPAVLDGAREVRPPRKAVTPDNSGIKF
ncbi:MAG: hypothetical protein B7Y51_09155 [Burkholderiales bacterium 28-67-8]|nr:MAG: hypothetical protein B7Y51_09155 [Burkholderiales bacterium 28-67-8]